MTARKTASQRARELRAKHPDWSLSRIGAAVGLTKQGVANALRQTGKRGRPKGISGVTRRVDGQSRKGRP